MANSLIRSGPGEELWKSERCFIRELLNDPDVSDVSLARTRVEPGMTTELHQLAARGQLEGGEQDRNGEE